VNKETTAKSTKGRKGSITHDKFKLEQRKVGQQLLASGAAYEAHEVARLPPEFRKDIGIKRIKDMSILHKDNAVERQKAERGGKACQTYRRPTHTSSIHSESCIDDSW
jgi:hypothetical protein